MMERTRVCSTSGSAGRITQATRAASKGDVLLSEQPLCIALHNGTHRDRCASCCSTTREGGGRTLLLCKGCRLHRYCSVRCQKDLWARGHKLECALVRRASPNVPTRTMRMAAQAMHVLDRCAVSAVVCTHICGLLIQRLERWRWEASALVSATWCGTPRIEQSSAPPRCKLLR